jgi:hypothetical protein
MTGNEATLAVIDGLESCSIPYMLVGSYSSNIYGVERSTQDADFVVELVEGAIGELSRRLPPAIRIDRQMSFETDTMTTRFVAKVAESPFKIEFFLLSSDPMTGRDFVAAARSPRPTAKSGFQPPRTSSSPSFAGACSGIVPRTATTPAT